MDCLRFEFSESGEEYPLKIGILGGDMEVKANFKIRVKSEFEIYFILDISLENQLCNI